MASSYSTDLKIELMVTGENAGTWGEKTNDNLNVIQQAIAGYGEQSIAGSAQTTALTIANSPTLSVARNIVIKLTGTITGNQIVTVPSGIEKTWIVSNGTTGAFTVEFKTVSGTGTTWSATDKAIKILYSDGTNINAVDITTLSGTVASAQIANLAVTSAKLASFAVTEARLASFAVTTSRLATNAVTAIKITQSTITQSKLAANSVGSNQLISTGVTAASYTSASITVDADGRITAASSGSAGAGGYDLNQVITGPSTASYTKTPGANRAHLFLYGAGGGGTAGNPGSTTQFGGNPGTAGARGGFGFVPGYSLANTNTIEYSLGAGGNAGPAPGSGGTGGASRLGPSPSPIITANGAAGATVGNATINPGPSGQAFLATSGFYNGVQPWGAGGAAGGGGFWNSPDGGNPNPGSPGSAGGAGVLVVWENTGT
jgi:hypothetical protein